MSTVGVWVMDCAMLSEGAEGQTGVDCVEGRTFKYQNVLMHLGVGMSGKNVRRTCSAAISMFGGTICRLCFSPLRGPQRGWQPQRKQ